jgi:hypothetical protein
LLCKNLLRMAFPIALLRETGLFATTLFVHDSIITGGSK